MIVPGEGEGGDEGFKPVKGHFGEHRDQPETLAAYPSRSRDCFFFRHPLHSNVVHAGEISLIYGYFSSPGNFDSITPGGVRVCFSPVPELLYQRPSRSSTSVLSFYT